MRAWMMLVTLAACGGTDHGIFDPQPGTPPPSPPADAPEEPTGAQPFRVTHDLRGTLGYCTNQATSGSTIGSCKAGARFADSLVANALVFENGDRVASCRIGHVPEVDSLPFTPCPTAVSGAVTLPITPTPNATDGNYRADLLYTDVDDTTKSYSTSFYVHRSIDGAAPCPTDPTTYPSNTRFFAEAVKQFHVPDPKLLKIRPSWINLQLDGVLPHATPFASSDVTHAPFYNLHFKNVRLGRYRQVGSVDEDLETTETTLTTSEFDVPIWSLRHRIAFNGDRTLVVIRRAYESRTAGRTKIDPVPNPKTGHIREACQMRLRFGARTHRVPVDCDALVLNSAGEGFCMQVSTDDESGEIVVAQAVFSITMVAKLTRGSVAGTPGSGDPSIWGRKVFERIGTIGEDGAPSTDEVFERDDTVVLRP